MKTYYRFEGETYYLLLEFVKVHPYNNNNYNVCKVLYISKHIPNSYRVGYCDYFPTCSLKNITEEEALLEIL